MDTPWHGQVLNASHIQIRDVHVYCTALSICASLNYAYWDCVGNWCHKISDLARDASQYPSAHQPHISRSSVHLKDDDENDRILLHWPHDPGNEHLLPLLICGSRTRHVSRLQMTNVCAHAAHAQKRVQERSALSCTSYCIAEP